MAVSPPSFCPELRAALRLVGLADALTAEVGVARLPLGVAGGASQQSRRCEHHAEPLAHHIARGADVERRRTGFVAFLVAGDGVGQLAVALELPPDLSVRVAHVRVVARPLVLDDEPRAILFELDRAAVYRPLADELARRFGPRYQHGVLRAVVELVEQRGELAVQPVDERATRHQRRQQDALPVEDVLEPLRVETLGDRPAEVTVHDRVEAVGLLERVVEQLPAVLGLFADGLAAELGDDQRQRTHDDVQPVQVLRPAVVLGDRLGALVVAQIGGVGDGVEREQHIFLARPNPRELLELHLEGGPVARILGLGKPGVGDTDGVVQPVDQPHHALVLAIDVLDAETPVQRGLAVRLDFVPVAARGLLVFAAGLFGLLGHVAEQRVDDLLLDVAQQLAEIDVEWPEVAQVGPLDAHVVAICGCLYRDLLVLPIVAGLVARGHKHPSAGRSRAIQPKPQRDGRRQGAARLDLYHRAQAVHRRYRRHNVLERGCGERGGHLGAGDIGVGADAVVGVGLVLWRADPIEPESGQHQRDHDRCGECRTQCDPPPSAGGGHEMPP